MTKACIEEIKLNLTITTEIKKTKINFKFKVVFFDASCVLFEECAINNDMKKKFKDINSTISQFHQPPQLNSWKAQNDPSKIDITDKLINQNLFFNIKNVKFQYAGFECFKFFKNKMRNKSTEYNKNISQGWIFKTPFNKAKFNFLKKKKELTPVEI